MFQQSRPNLARRMQRFKALVACECQLNTDATGSRVEKDLTLDCVVQNVAGQDFPTSHEVFSLVEGHFKSLQRFAGTSSGA